MNMVKIIILLCVILITITAKVSAQTSSATQPIVTATQNTNAISSDELKLALMEKELQVSKDFMLMLTGFEKRKNRMKIAS